MNANNSQIADNGGQIIGSQIVGDNNKRVKNSNRTGFTWKFYLLVGASSFIGGVLASIIANLITKYL